MRLDNVCVLDSTSRAGVFRKIPGLKSSARQKEARACLKIDDAFQSLTSIRNMLPSGTFKKWEEQKLAVRVGSHILRSDGSISTCKPDLRRRKLSPLDQTPRRKRYSNPPDYGKQSSIDVDPVIQPKNDTPTERRTPTGNVIPVQGVWGSDKIVSISVDGTWCHPSFSLIPDPNYGTFRLVIGGRDSSTHVLASTLNKDRRRYDTFNAPLHMKRGIVRIQLKLPFVAEFESMTLQKVLPTTRHSESATLIETQLAPSMTSQSPRTSVELEVSSHGSLNIPSSHMKCNKSSLETNTSFIFYVGYDGFARYVY